MQRLLTHENLDEVMKTYHGFHDAEIESIIVRPLQDRSGYLNVEVELLATNHQTQRPENIKLLLHKVIEMRFSYDKNTDYPNVRDEIAIGFFAKLAYIDFGSACEPRKTIEEYRSADSYFVCESVSLS